MKSNCLTLILLSAVSYHGAVADTAFKIIELKYHMVQDILPTIQKLVGNDGLVTGLNNQLIIRTNSSRMAEIEKTIATLDIARRNLKITVRHDAINQRQQNSTGVQGNTKIDNITVWNSRGLPLINAEINIERNTSDINEHSRQFINVIDGERAFISTGQIVPYTQEWVILTRRYVQLQQTIEFKDVSTGFAVRARSTGGEKSNEFILEIMPRITSLNNSGYIDFEELTSTVHVRKGEWFDLGGTMLYHDEVSRQILNAQNYSSQQNSSLTIRVD